MLYTLNQILLAAIAITAFSLLLYSLTFNLRERVARSFSLILIWLVIIYASEAFSTAAKPETGLLFWLNAQWLGIVFLPAAYLHFSDAVLTMTGRPSKGKRRWTTRIFYAISALFLVTLILGYLVGEVIDEQNGVPFLQPNWLTDVFILYYLLGMTMSWYNLIRAYQRSVTSTGRRRIGYILIGSLAPTLGSLPFMMYASGFGSRHTILFWSLSVLTNSIVIFLIVVMAYAVAFFGEGLPDRLIKSRLLKWLLRGPVVASLVLLVTTVISRLGSARGTDLGTYSTIAMLLVIILGEYAITLFFPYVERWFFLWEDDKDLVLLKGLENRFITEPDLKQFLEVMLSTICDRLQAPGAYVLGLPQTESQVFAKIGFLTMNEDDLDSEALKVVNGADGDQRSYVWGNDLLIPLREVNVESGTTLLGIVGLTGLAEASIDEEHWLAISSFSSRMMEVLKDHHIQDQIVRSVRQLSDEPTLIQSLRAAGRFDQSIGELDELAVSSNAFSQWVKDALTHFWGGPKLSDSPLMKLKIVDQLSVEHGGNNANALRAVLRKAIDLQKPQGERRYTGEWILYNLLEMKFMEGKKVRDIAARLAMSEADLYRKQRVAVEAVAKSIQLMEDAIESDDHTQEKAVL
ncbi:MAG TPA: histidine kinase N-terminal 7TM domain-containing protein [Bellilinea sp.]|nr:histidine kinase N-terminal 7TM domain-containing protein [Bellilinea sp.]